MPKTQSFFLFGPRGSGKSTWLKSQFTGSSLLWIDLLNQKTEFELAQDPDRLLALWKGLKSKPEWVIVDEVQKIPRLLDVVHRGIEEHRIRFALTGSSARKLKRGGANLLAGRAVERQLLPFSALELGQSFNLKHALEFGLLPKIWDERGLSNADQADFLYAYVNTYLKEEIAAEQLVRSLDPFRRFLICAAQCNGKVINQSKIGRDAGTPQRQVARHFEILIDTLIGAYLEPFHQSVRKRQTEHSKFYFFDTGVVRALQNLAGESVRPSTFEYGELFEAFLINEFFKLRSALNLRWNYSYLLTPDDVEIDLIIEKPRGKPVLIEIKSFDQVKRDKISRFAKISREIEHSGAYVLSNCENTQEIDGLRCMHWKNGLKELFDLSGA